MKIFPKCLLFWITISWCSFFASGSGSRLENEELDFYRSLNDSDDSQAVLGKDSRDKRAKVEQFKEGVYESEVKVLGHVDGEVKERVERASGDSDFSISETPINPTTSYQDPIPSDQDNDDSSTEISVFDPSMSKVHPNTTINDTKVHPDSSDRKLSENESDMGSGIEVDSEEKLDDEDSAESQSSSQSFIVEDDSDNKITLSSRSDTMEEVLWPSGTYGLPKPLSGCPESSGFVWNTGLRFYDTEDDGTENHNSVAFHLAGDVTEDGVTLEFCMKTKDVGIASWPSGKYCVYKKGGVCPNGLKSGFVYWDDENRENKNFFDGILPEGTYTDKTKISFCCSTTGSVNSAIALPTEKPFYLFPYGSPTCQKVKKMQSTLEFVKFDEEDKGDIEKSAGGFYPYGIRPQEKDHTFYLCYYQLQEKDNLLSASEGIVNSQKIVHSEEIVHDFVKPKETNQTDEIEMEQQPRTRNGKKFQGMQNSMYHAIMIATGFVLTTVAILVGALVVISYFTKRWSRDLTRNSNKSSNGPKEIKKECKEIKPKEERVQCDLASEKEKQGSWTENNFAETETEQEDEELVEDQFLPSDSQLKSGLEFLFLKQQKRRWLARNSRNK